MRAGSRQSEVGWSGKRLERARGIHSAVGFPVNPSRESSGSPVDIIGDPTGLLRTIEKEIRDCFRGWGDPTAGGRLEGG